MSGPLRLKEIVSHASLNCQVLVVHASRRLSLLLLRFWGDLEELDYLVRPVPGLCLGRMLSNHSCGTKRPFFMT